MSPQGPVGICRPCQSAGWWCQSTPRNPPPSQQPQPLQVTGPGGRGRRATCVSAICIHMRRARVRVRIRAAASAVAAAAPASWSFLLSGPRLLRIVPTAAAAVPRLRFFRAPGGLAAGPQLGDSPGDPVTVAPAGMGVEDSALRRGRPSRWPGDADAHWIWRASPGPRCRSSLRLVYAGLSGPLNGRSCAVPSAAGQGQRQRPGPVAQAPPPLHLAPYLSEFAAARHPVRTCIRFISSQIRSDTRPHGTTLACTALQHG